MKTICEMYLLIKNKGTKFEKITIDVLLFALFALIILISAKII